jgi:hypothetical protein
MCLADPARIGRRDFLPGLVSLAGASVAYTVRAATPGARDPASDGAALPMAIATSAPAATAPLPLTPTTTLTSDSGALQYSPC